MWKNFIIITFIVLIADQITKFIAEKYLVSAQSVQVIGNFFQLTLVKNPHGLWGMKLFPVVLPVIGISIILVIIVFFKTNLMPLSLICGGAIGNFIDRVRFGAVTDFLDFGIGRFRWAVFNIADAGITIGVLLLIIQSMLNKRKFK